MNVRASDSSVQSSNLQSTSETEIQQWIVDRLAEELHVSPGRIDIEQPILSLGVDSMKIVSVMSDLEDRCGFRFSENPLDDHPTIKALAKFVVESISEKHRKP